jgi:hypothetical protein
MFKIGESVVCIRVDNCAITYLLKLHNVYIVEDISKNHKELIKIIGFDHYFDIIRFESLYKLRRKKIEKICSKLEIR